MNIGFRCYTGSGQPDVDRAALARVAGFSMVAYDNNALENQFLQGWLIQDRFMLQGTFGAPYEYLWANPYQPGLSYFQMPLLYHNPKSGALFVRSNWEDDAVWFGLYQGEAQVFQDGRITVLNRVAQSGAETDRHRRRQCIVCPAAGAVFDRRRRAMLVVGLKPQHKYLIETDDEELCELEADRAGTLELAYPAGRSAGVRIRESDQIGVNGG